MLIKMYLNPKAYSFEALIIVWKILYMILNAPKYIMVLLLTIDRRLATRSYIYTIIAHIVYRMCEIRCLSRYTQTMIAKWNIHNVGTRFLLIYWRNRHVARWETHPQHLLITIKLCACKCFSFSVYFIMGWADNKIRSGTLLPWPVAEYVVIGVVGRAVRISWFIIFVILFVWFFELKVNICKSSYTFWIHINSHITLYKHWTASDIWWWLRQVQ